MADICDSCAFEDACPSAHFNITDDEGYRLKNSNRPPEGEKNNG